MASSPKSNSKQEQQSMPILQEIPSIQQQASTAQVITENAGSEENKLKEKPFNMSPYPSETITRYTSEQELKKEAVPKGTVLSATASILKSGVGTGILFLPSVFKQCGIILSIIFMIVCSFVCYFCWSLIGKVIRFQESTDTNDPNNKNLTLEATGGILYGQKFKTFLQVCTYGYSYSVCFGYSIFIYQALEETIPNHMVTLAIMFAIFLPLSMYKQIDKLSIFTYIALSATIITLFIIIGKSCYIIDNTTIDFGALNHFDFTALPLQFGVFTFAYDINGVYTEVHASMKDKSQFNNVLKYYLIIFTSLGILVGTMGYVAFGEAVEPVIFTNIGAMSGVGTALSFLYSLAELSSMLLYIFTVIKFLDRIINTHILKQSSKCMTFFQELTLRTCVFLSFSFLALYVNKISAVFNILGCIFCTSLTYICPYILFRKAKSKQTHLQNKIQQSDIEKDTPVEAAIPKIQYLNTKVIITIIACICLVFGLLGGISGLISTIISLSE